MGQQRGISVVCVFNDERVRRECLDASLAAGADPDVDVDYLPVDNTHHAFASAGAALNHGARAARHDLVVLVHQDVYLHSVGRLLDLEQHLADGWGLVGACGITAGGEVVGRIRDRVVLDGSDTDVPRAVDSVDEVLFAVRREQLLAEPLTEDPDLAWHAYAVEYGVRLRAGGLAVGAMTCGVTHNSLSINLDRLDVAHRRVAELHPAALPVVTTCGVVGATAHDWRDLPVVRDHRWRLRWLRGSQVAREIARTVDVPVVLADVRLDVDRIAHETGEPLHVLALDRPGGVARYGPSHLVLTRRDRPIHLRALPDRAALLAALGEVPDGETVLVTGLRPHDVVEVVGGRRGADWVVGVHEGEPWLLGGVARDALPESWSGVRARPRGLARL